jgi:hypothetical protein
MSDALRSYRIGTVAAFAAGGALALFALGIRDRWPEGLLLCLASSCGFALCLTLALGWVLDAGVTDAPGASIAAPPAEASDPRFPITATEPALAAELLLASLTTHPPCVPRGPAT